MFILFRKFLNHGLTGSILIVRHKSLKLFENYRIKWGRYSFSTQTKLLDNISIKLFDFFNNYKLKKENNNLNFNYVERPLLNQFFLLGKNYDFTSNINWHFNSDNIHESYPEDYSKNIKILNYKQFGDYRITWELNRHQHFVWYAQSYYCSNNERYIEKIIEELNHWVSKNKVGYGINYSSPMEISIRLINWLLAFNIISQRADVKSKINNNITNNILAQLVYLNNNLFIKRKFRNNHSIVELAGLIVYQSIIKSKKIYNLDKLYNWLFKELSIQFYDDGINFEHSPTYSRFTIESLLFILIFVKDKQFDQENKKLNKLVLEYVLSLRAFVTPENSVPLFSDCDNGRISFLEGTNKDFHDFRGFFDFCGIYFNNNSLFISRSSEELNEETKWWCFLADKEPKLPLINEDESKIQLFPVGGYFSYKKHTTFLIFKAGYPGNINLTEEYAPHAHNDSLSFELYLKNEPILVDSGTYTYNLFDNGQRDYFRSIYAHNTVIVNSKNQIEHHEAFGAKNYPNVNIKKISDSEIEGELFSNDNYRIKRNIKINEHNVVFTDEVDRLNELSQIEINLNFHNSIEINKIDNHNKKIEFSNKTQKFCLIIEQSDIINFNIARKDNWISKNYNEKIKSNRISIGFSQIRNNFIIKWRIEQNSTHQI